MSSTGRSLLTLDSVRWDNFSGRDNQFRMTASGNMMDMTQAHSRDEYGLRDGQLLKLGSQAFVLV